MPTYPPEVILKIGVEVATENKVAGVEVPMPTKPVSKILILSVPAVEKIIAALELAVRVLAEEIKVELAD